MASARKFSVYAKDKRHRARLVVTCFGEGGAFVSRVGISTARRRQTAPA